MLKLNCKARSVLVSLGKRSEVVIGSCYEGGCRKWGIALHHGLGRSPRSLCICSGSKLLKQKIDCHEYQRKPEAMLDTVTIAFCIIYINGTNNLFQLISFLSRYKLMHPHNSIHYRALFEKAKEQCTDLLCCNHMSTHGM